MWAPNQKEALVEILANRAPLSGISVHKEGVYMTTVGLDNCMKYFLLELQIILCILESGICVTM